MMIRLNNISFSYDDKQVIKNFSLNIKEGDRICFFGASGCGKTTLLKLILGLEKPQKGSIEGISDLKFSTVFQDNRLLPFKTVLQNITLFGASKQAAQESLEALGIGAKKDLYPKKLSGGMEKRVALARAVSVDFDILILDEPFNGLDKENIDLAAKYILKKCGNKPIIMVTHSLEEAKLFNAEIIKL